MDSYSLPASFRFLKLVLSLSFPPLQFVGDNGHVLKRGKEPKATTIQWVLSKCEFSPLLLVICL